MPQFNYKVKHPTEGLETGMLEADNERAAAARLKEQGYYPISLDEVQAAKTTATYAFRSRRIRLKDKNLFFRQLANLLQSGMPITRALGVLEQYTENDPLRRVVAQVRQAVEEGSSLAVAFEAHPAIFPAMYVSLVRAGEEGGMLTDVLWRIVSFGDKDEELRGKAFTALLYPAFLAIVSFAAVFTLMTFVFPNFVQVFEDLNARLPLPTRLVIGVSSFLGNFWWAVLAGGGVLVLLVSQFLKTKAGRTQFDGFILGVPLFGPLVQRFEMAKLARALGTLFDNAVPVLDALRIAGSTLSNSQVRTEVERVEDRVRDGSAISAAMQDSAVFPPLVVNMLASGEETGKLGEVTKNIAEAYEVEVDRAVKAMTALLEPLIVVVMGVVVGFLVIAMLLPMLTLSGQIR